MKSKLNELLFPIYHENLIKTLKSVRHDLASLLMPLYFSEEALVGETAAQFSQYLAKMDAIISLNPHLSYEEVLERALIFLTEATIKDGSIYFSSDTQYTISNFLEKEIAITSSGVVSNTISLELLGLVKIVYLFSDRYTLTPDGIFKGDIK